MSFVYKVQFCKMGVPCYICACFYGKRKINQVVFQFKSSQNQVENTKSLRLFVVEKQNKKSKNYIIWENKNLNVYYFNQKLFISETDTIVDSVFKSLSNASIRVVGPELIFGKYMIKLVLMILRKIYFVI